MRISQLQGTPWHEEKMHRKEGDSRRSKARCCYHKFNDGCSKVIGKCMGTAHCSHYRALSEKEFKQRQTEYRQWRQKHPSANTHKKRHISILENDGSGSLKNYEYKGEIYHFSRGRWIDDKYYEVDIKTGQELSTVFGEGRGYYFSESKPKTREKPKTVYSLPEPAEKKKAYIKKPSFAPYSDGDSENVNSLAHYYGVRSLDYKKISVVSLGLPTKVTKALRAEHINTIDVLLRLSWDEVMKIVKYNLDRRRSIETQLKAFIDMTKQGKR